ncbi:Uncharacterised protein [Escherichia coli]|uniref:Uncharacterized protein n=1 Tax=Escherichia coli TaxID=562 RepID=A0A377A238_ECOLX|nr:Uncharacterised protein [Escherichia coli]
MMMIYGMFFLSCAHCRISSYSKQKLAACEK